MTSLRDSHHFVGRANLVEPADKEERRPLALDAVSLLQGRPGRPPQRRAEPQFPDNKQPSQAGAD